MLKNKAYGSLEWKSNSKKKLKTKYGIKEEQKNEFLLHMFSSIKLNTFKSLKFLHISSSEILLLFY